MIYGIGTDLIGIARMAEALERRGERFARRLLDEHELAEFRAVNNKAAFLARRFAAKEAMAKALGTGLMTRFGLQDIGVDHDAAGKPVARLSDKASAVLDELGVRRLHLSISDDHAYAQAFAIAEK